MTTLTAHYREVIERLPTDSTLILRGISWAELRGIDRGSWRSAGPAHQLRSGDDADRDPVIRTQKLRPANRKIG